MFQWVVGLRRMQIGAISTCRWHCCCCALCCRGSRSAKYQCLESGITECGLGVWRSKFTVLEVLCKKKSRAIRDHHVPYKDVKLPFVQPDDKIHCLAINSNPWRRKPKFAAGAKLLSVAEHCHNLPLKPHQKINSISQYLTPEFLYVLIEDALSSPLISPYLFQTVI